MTLTVALALLAVAVLLALALQGWWSARRLQPRPAAAAEAPLSRLEPDLNGNPDRAESGTDTAFSDTQPGPLSHALRRAVPRLDPLIDALVTLRLDSPVVGALAVAHQPAARRAGAKPLYIEGLDTETGEWEPLTTAHRYSELQAGVQLANRSGPLNEIEYSEFVQKVQSYAEAVGASPEIPDMLEVVARARELDGLSSPLDAQLNISLRSNGAPWSVALVQQIAARLGFMPGSVPGRMVVPAAQDAAPPLLLLTLDPNAALAEDPQASVVSQCLVTLDVPQTAEDQEPFPAFYRAVTELAAGLDATPVDNDGVPISLQAFSTIGKELEDLYQQMQALDLAAGSAAARRLFS